MNLAGQRMASLSGLGHPLCEAMRDGLTLLPAWINYQKTFRVRSHLAMSGRGIRVTS